MKHITHNGITYEVEDGWEGMESWQQLAYEHERVLRLYDNGCVETTTPSMPFLTWSINPSAWRPIVAPRVVEPVRRFEVIDSKNWGYSVWDDQCNANDAVCIPTRAAAEEIAAIYEREYRNA
jgi:hypothetical protein